MDGLAQRAGHGGIAAVVGVFDTRPQHALGHGDDHIVDEDIAKQVGREGGRDLLNVTGVEVVRRVLSLYQRLYVGEYFFVENVEMVGIDYVVKNDKAVGVDGMDGGSKMVGFHLAVLYFFRRDVEREHRISSS